MFDGKAFGAEIVTAVKAHLDASLRPLVSRIEKLESKEPEVNKGDVSDLRKAIEALRGDIPEVEPLPDIGAMVSEAVSKAVSELPEPEKPDVEGLVQAAIDGAVGVVDSAVDDAVKKAVDELPKPKDGKDADVELIKSMVDEAVAAIPEPETPDINAMVSEAVTKAIAELPKPEKPDFEGLVKVAVDDAVKKAVAELPNPKDGKDADVDLIKSMVDEAVSKLPEPEPLPDINAMVLESVKAAVDAIPAPQDGHSVSIDDVAPMIKSEIEKRVSELPRPADGKQGESGVGLAGALVDRNGNLVVTLSNGETKELGRITGHDGNPGVDGLGFEDMTEHLEDDGRTIVRRYMRGEQVKEFRHSIPHMIYRGVYKSGDSYAKGDMVTFGGSLWHCDADTTDKPDGGESWTLAAKRGRDGKDGVMKAEKPKTPIKVG